MKYLLELDGHYWAMTFEEAKAHLIGEGVNPDRLTEKSGRIYFDGLAIGYEREARQ